MEPWFFFISVLGPDELFRQKKAVGVYTSRCSGNTNEIVWLSDEFDRKEMLKCWNPRL